MIDIVKYRIIGDMTRTTTGSHFNELMKKGLFDSSEIVYYCCHRTNHYKTQEEKIISETPLKSEDVLL